MTYGRMNYSRGRDEYELDFAGHRSIVGRLQCRVHPRTYELLDDIKDCVMAHGEIEVDWLGHWWKEYPMGMFVLYQNGCLILSDRGDRILYREYYGFLYGELMDVSSGGSSIVVVRRFLQSLHYHHPEYW